MINNVPTRDDPTQEDYTIDVPHAVSYSHVREVGRPVYHQVQLFATYSKEVGCKNKLLETEGTIAHCLKEMRSWPISKEQINRVHNLMSYRQDGIMTSDLKFFKY